MTRIPESDEVRHEQFWRDGGGFVWIRPRFHTYRVAKDNTKGNPGRPIRFRVGLNRYPHNVIGAYVVLFERSFGVNWKGSPKPVAPESPKEET